MTHRILLTATGRPFAPLRDNSTPKRTNVQKNHRARSHRALCCNSVIDNSPTNTKAPSLTATTTTVHSFLTFSRNKRSLPGTAASAPSKIKLICPFARVASHHPTPTCVPCFQNRRAVSANLLTIFFQHCRNRNSIVATTSARDPESTESVPGPMLCLPSCMLRSQFLFVKMIHVALPP